MVLAVARSFAGFRILFLRLGNVGLLTVRRFLIFLSVTGPAGQMVQLIWHQSACRSALAKDLSNEVIIFQAMADFIEGRGVQELDHF